MNLSKLLLTVSLSLLSLVADASETVELKSREGAVAQFKIIEVTTWGIWGQRDISPTPLFVPWTLIDLNHMAEHYAKLEKSRVELMGEISVFPEDFNPTREQCRAIIKDLVQTWKAYRPSRIWNYRKVVYSDGNSRTVYWVSNHRWHQWRIGQTWKTLEALTLTNDRPAKIFDSFKRDLLLQNLIEESARDVISEIKRYPEHSSDRELSILLQRIETLLDTIEEIRDSGSAFRVDHARQLKRSLDFLEEFAHG